MIDTPMDLFSLCVVLAILCYWTYSISLYVIRRRKRYRWAKNRLPLNQYDTRYDLWMQRHLIPYLPEWERNKKELQQMKQEYRDFFNGLAFWK
jgi:hypothetical protein